LDGRQDARRCELEPGARAAPIAAFIYNTETKTLIKYSIDGLRARIVK
jgi:hypothetical protein